MHAAAEKKWKKRKWNPLFSGGTTTGKKLRGEPIPGNVYAMLGKR